MFEKGWNNNKKGGESESLKGKKIKDLDIDSILDFGWGHLHSLQ